MLERVRRLFERLEDAVLVAVLAAMIALAAAQIVLRNLFGVGIAWADPLLRVLVLWAGLVGAMVAARADRHIVVSALARLLPARAQAAARALTDAATAAVCVTIAIAAARLVQSEYAAGTPAFAAVPAWVCQLVIPVGFGVIGARYALAAALRLRALARGGA